MLIQDEMPILGRASVDVKRRGRGHNVRRQRRESVYRCDMQEDIYQTGAHEIVNERASRRHDVARKVRVYEGAFCRNALRCVVGEHLLAMSQCVWVKREENESTYVDKVEAFSVEVWNLLRKILSRPARERRLVVRQLRYTGPGALIGSTEYPGTIGSAT